MNTTKAGHAPDAVTILTFIVKDVFDIADPVVALTRAGLVFALLHDAGYRIINAEQAARQELADP